MSNVAMDGVVALGKAKQLINSSITGIGSSKVVDNKLVITFNNGKTQTIIFPTPKDGVSVVDIDINDKNQIVFTMSDGTEIVSNSTIPVIKGDSFTYDDFTKEQLEELKGKDGVSPTVTITESTGRHTVSFSDKNGVKSITIKDGSPEDMANYYTKDKTDEKLNLKANTSDIPIIPTNLSELNNDENYIKNTAENLTNYYKKTETYSQTEVNTLLANINKLTSKIVTKLPSEDISENTIYLIEVESQENVYMQYMYINGSFAALGTTAIDLSNVYTKGEVDKKLEEKADKTEIPTIPTLISSFTNDKGYITEFTETDPTVPAWAKTENKPSYTAAEVGALPDDTEIPIFINKTVLDGITAEKVDNWDDAVETKTNLEVHTNNMVSSETGVHGIRYYSDKLQVKNESAKWVDIGTGGDSSENAPNDVSNIKIKTGDTKLTIAWGDPSDTVIEGQTLSAWKGTKLIQKVGSYPENPKDGTVIVDNQVRDKYKTNGFEVTGLTNGETYYFALFPYSDTGAVNTNVANRIKGTPQGYRKMTAIIDLSNSNPLSAVTYADDAVGMTEGSEDWDDFFGHYPVLLDASGNELGKLNPNNYAQYEDGTAAPINVLGSYDVMVAFPKRGLKISTESNKVTVSMTDDPDNADFKYYAHSYGAHNNCDVVYVGAYKASANGTKLYSCSGQSPLGEQTIGTFRTYANNRGEGYEQMTFYVRTFLCCAYILRFGNLNSQSAVGQGYVKASEKTNTGATNSHGMNYGTTSQTTQIKCLGIEDLWGNVNEWVDGIFSSSTRNILTAIYNKNMNDTGSGYKDNGQGAAANIGNYMNKPQGTTETGFVAKEVSGSASTYFCDYAGLYASSLAAAGGNYGNTGNAGVFRLYVSVSASRSSASIGGRLIKFKTAK